MSNLAYVLSVNPSANPIKNILKYTVRDCQFCISLNVGLVILLSEIVPLKIRLEDLLARFRTQWKVLVTHLMSTPVVPLYHFTCNPHCSRNIYIL